MIKPRFVLSRSRVIEQYNRLASLGVSVTYSHKTNPEVARVLEEETDCMFSIHNSEHIGHIRDKKRIWFFPQGWKPGEFNKIYQSGVSNFVVDNHNDLNVLTGNINGKRVNLLLRMRMQEHTLFTGRFFVFGMKAADVNSLIPQLRSLKGITRLGVHFHRRTQNVSEWRLKEEISSTLSKEALDSLDIINIGGGLPGEYKNTSAKAVELAFSEIRALGEWAGGIEIMVEPGRFIAAPAVKLEVGIVNIYDNTIVVNCSVYSGAMDTIVVPIKLLVEGELEETEARKLNLKPYTIKGISPDSMDIFRYRVFLKQPKVGQKLVFLNAGAYNYHCDFCGYKKLKTVIVA